VSKHIIGVLLAGLLSFALADSVKMKDGSSYEGKVQYRDADIVKLKLAGPDEVMVFFTRDVAEVLVDSLSAQPVLPDRPRSPDLLSPEYWERVGYADGSKAAGPKAALAGVGACIGVPLGGYLGAATGAGTQGCVIGMAAGGLAGCLGGKGLAATAPGEAVSPTSDPVSREAYMRGFRKGVDNSNTIATGVGAGAAILSAVGCVSFLLYMLSLMIID
jgi:hypothetical protein